MNKLAVFWLLLAVLVPIRPLAQTRTEQGAVTVDVKGPLILGFFPPFTKAEEQLDDGGINEGLAHLRFALEDIAKCYDNKAATYRLEVTKFVTLRQGRTIRRIALSRDWEHAVGIIFATPRRQHRIVFAEAGPSSLIVIGPSTAAEYFGAQTCRREP